MTEDIGTVRWFGDSWGAPVNDPRSRVDVPVGEPCGGDCDRQIGAEDAGIGVPHIPGGRYGWWHLDCWFRSLGFPFAVLSADESLHEVAKQIVGMERERDA